MIRVKGRLLDDLPAVQVSSFVFEGGACSYLFYSDGHNDWYLPGVRQEDWIAVLSLRS